MGSDIFQETRERVTALQAAERYGVEVRRGWCRCPFHGGGTESTPSLKFYENGSFHCFACGVGGSSIDFISLLYGVPPLEAVKRLNTDFGLGLELDGPPPDRAAIERRERRERIWKDFQSWMEQTVRDLTEVYREAHKALQQVDGAGNFGSLSPEQAAAIASRERIDELLEFLQSDDLDEQMEVFRMRGEVEMLCARVLKNSLLRSRTA